ncbi:hypothetical protein HRI_002405800 [Hibiscus trionum]|uniref:Protein kinase domain-containing protein n=1 Tax=Hibiscus trionum TaxID=183268 RepID=A0A9W7M6E9_HIBTR|nr:hypothetical protein HRI_002405800 [Hibiscus trionum]
MGNCLRKKSHDPNQPPPEPARPPTGDDAVKSSRSRKMSTSPVQQKTPSGPSQSSKSNHCKDEQCRATRQERHKHVSSHSPKENQKKSKGHGSPTTRRDWPKYVVWVPAKNINSFYYSVLRAATHKFSDENIIGEGGFGRVYIGYINPHSMSAAKPGTGKAVAIKVLRRRGVQNDKEWQNELRFLKKLNHPNVVKLMGYCNEGDHRIVVYEYMSKGSLDAHLLRENYTELNWSRRIKIAIGVARAVDYLHSCAKPIIHRDLKASNVLLDADFNPKLSDFGLARYGPLEDQSHVSSGVVGTRGYFAPEYFTTGHLTVKTDVYSFGVVLLELFCGCVAVKRSSDGTERELAVWAKPHLSNHMELHNIIDKKIARNIDMEEAHKFASIICRCLSSDPKNRLTMGEVLASLEQLQQDMSLSNLNTLRLSKYHRRPHILQ